MVITIPELHFVVTLLFGFLYAWWWECGFETFYALRKKQHSAIERWSSDTSQPFPYLAYLIIFALGLTYGAVLLLSVSGIFVLLAGGVLKGYIASPFATALVLLLMGVVFLILGAPEQIKKQSEPQNFKPWQCPIWVLFRNVCFGLAVALMMVTLAV